SSSTPRRPPASPLFPYTTLFRSITDARTSHSDDLRHRQIRYLFSMGIRTLCFVGAVVVDSWLRWVLVAGAVFLPYIAVVMANAVDRKSTRLNSSHVKISYAVFCL